jgi:lipid II:glycine glycyltransferase (peptidoglycan interpeptide bridge formation enzyme)
MSASRRRQIKNGLKSGAEIIEPENLKQLKAFYHILYALYRYKVNKPLPDWSFFSQFYKQTLKHWNTETLDHKNTETQKHNNSVGIIRLIQYKDKIIGGILAPIWQNKVIYEWYVCGLDHEYKAQYPSVLATWAAIDYAIENKIETFDFMGVGTPEKDYGVRDFKARFGGDMVNYGRFTRVNNKTLYGIAELGYNVLALFKKI